jgi:hypothetical protein
MNTTAQATQTVLNFDNHGSYWGASTVADTEEMIERAQGRGEHINEWHETDRVGRPLRIVRIADPDFLDTICVIPLGVGECPNCGAPLSSTAATLDEHHPKCPRHDPRF